LKNRFPKKPTKMIEPMAMRAVMVSGSMSAAHHSTTVTASIPSQSIMSRFPISG